MLTTSARLALVLGLGFVVVVPHTLAQSWPAWMGPHADGSAAAGGLFPEHGAPPLVEIWRDALGSGYSSVSVAEGRAVTLGAKNGDAFAVAYDASTGEELWRYLAPRRGEEPGDAPLSTPTLDTTRVFALFTNGYLVALGAADGKPLWQRDLVAELEGTGLSYGFATSPVVVGEHLVVLAGGETGANVVALNKANGKLIWSAGHGRLASYGTPVVLTLGGVRQIVVPAGDTLYAVAPDDGKLLWTFDGAPFPDRNPLLLPGDRLFVALEDGSVMLKVQRTDEGAFRITEDWRSPKLGGNSYSPVVHLDGTLYGVSGPILRAADAATGEILWGERTGGIATLVRIDEQLVLVEQATGELRLAAASPEGYRELHRQPLFAPGVELVTPPSFADGKIFFRNVQEVVALEVAGSPPPAGTEVPPSRSTVIPEPSRGFGPG